jgi:hypothetical protein
MIYVWLRWRRCSILSIFIIVFASLINPFIFLQNSSAFSSNFQPAAPEGSEFGFVDIEYKYYIYTTSLDAEWMFDWGDGATSSWLKLDKNSTMISKSHSWNSSGEFEVKVAFRDRFFPQRVFSSPKVITISNITPQDIPNPPIINPPVKTGSTQRQYSFSLWSTQQADKMIQYRIHFDDGNVSDWTGFVSSNDKIQIPYYWKNCGEYQIKGQVKDQYNLISEWSSSINISIKNDTDNDGVFDELEKIIGSNSNDASDVKWLAHNEDEYAIIIASETNLFFYNASFDVVIPMHFYENNMYFVDENGDDSWNYVYNSFNHELASYDESLYKIPYEIPWLIIGIIGIICGVVVCIFILIKLGYIYIYEEEIGIDK